MRNGSVFTPGTTFGVDMSLHLGESSAKTQRTKARTPGPSPLSTFAVLLHSLYRIFLPLVLTAAGILLFRRLYSLQYSRPSGFAWMTNVEYCSSGASNEVFQELAAQKMQYEMLHRAQDSHRSKVESLVKQLDSALSSVTGLQSRVSSALPQNVDISGWKKETAQFKTTHQQYLHELEEVKQRVEKLANQAGKISGGGSSSGGGGGKPGNAGADPSEKAVREINERIDAVSRTLDQLKERTNKLQATTSTMVTPEDVQREINQRIAQEMPHLTAKQEAEMRKRVKELVSGQCLDSSNLEQLVGDAVAASARSTTIVVGAGEVVGRPDYAARSNGGLVVPHMTTASFTPDDVWLSSNVAHYFNIENGVGSPNDAISEDVSPGSCWAMAGTHGQLTVDLAVPIVVDAVTVDHAPFNTVHDVSSAPKEFEVWGYVSRADRPKLLGKFKFDLSKHHVQTFKLTSPASDRLSRVTMKVLSNHGNEDYTCIYRFRVHGRQ